MKTNTNTSIRLTPYRPNVYFFFFPFFFFTPPPAGPPADGVTPETPGAFVAPPSGTDASDGVGAGLLFCIFRMRLRLSASKRFRNIDECVLYFKHWKWIRPPLGIPQKNNSNRCIIRDFKDKVSFRTPPFYTVACLQKIRRHQKHGKVLTVRGDFSYRFSAAS